MNGLTWVSVLFYSLPVYKSKWFRSCISCDIRIEEDRTLTTEMEKSLQSRLQQTTQERDVSGCIVADRHGLCLASSSGNQELSGLVAAISQKASKIEPDSSSPVIVFNHRERSCMIHSHSGAVTAIFKTQAAQV